MTLGNLSFGIPNIDVARSRGGTVNPCHFVGHQLVVLFLPNDAREQAVELEQYEKLASDIADVDGWLLAIGSEPGKSGREGIPIAFDPNGKVWGAFTEVAKAEDLDRSKGATFLFTRGGAFHRFWSGPGHASDVLEELRSRG